VFRLPTTRLIPSSSSMSFVTAKENLHFAFICIAELRF
jgi:hypothetical protein